MIVGGHTMLRKIRNLFITGLLVLLPLVMTVYLIWYLFIFLDNLSSPIFTYLLGRDIPGIGVMFAIGVIFIVGLLTTNILGKKIIDLGEYILLKIPLFRNIYLSIKRILDGIFTTNNASFKKAVMFEYPRKGIYQIGFLTKESSNLFEKITGEKMYNVFLPTTPNPTSGMFIMVPIKEVYELNISVEEALKLIISGGILSPAEKPGILQKIID